MSKVEFVEEKLVSLVDKMYKIKLIDEKSLKLLKIAIHYYYYNITYADLENIYGVSKTFVRQALHGNLVRKFLGEDFYNALQEKCKTSKREAYKKRNLIDIHLLSEEELLSINIIKKEGKSIHTRKELNMMRTSILYIEKNYSYSQMSSILGYSKASISDYLTDEYLEELLKEEYYQIINDKLLCNRPSPSHSIVSKKERLTQFIQFISEEDLTLEKLKAMNVYSLANQFGISNSSMYYYLNDPYFEELLLYASKNDGKRM